MKVSEARKIFSGETEDEACCVKWPVLLSPAVYVSGLVSPWCACGNHCCRLLDSNLPKGISNLCSLAPTLKNIPLQLI